MGGGGVPPPGICQTDGPTLDLKTEFERFGLEFSEHAAKFYLKVTNDVTSRVKSLF